MTGTIRTSPRRPLSLVALIAAAGVVFALLCAQARAATIESQQVTAGLHNATLEAKINPGGVATSCRAQYLSKTELEAGGWGAATTIPCAPEALGSGTAGVPVSAPIGNLALSTEYHYRFLLEAAGVTTPGAEGSFSTFGIESFSFRTLNAAGEPETRAGAHPAELIVELATPVTEISGLPQKNPTGTIKDLLSELPPGLVGNPTALPSCAVRAAEENKCSGNAQVGTVTVLHGKGIPESAPLYNTIPPLGAAARFTGEINISTDAFIDSGVRTGSDYGITSGGFNISATANVFAVTVNLWGVPANPTHDADRVCPIPGSTELERGCASTAPERPFLRNPTSCGGPLTARARVDAYQSPGEFAQASTSLPAMTGCDQLDFEPTIEARPTTDLADSPTGFHVDLHVPQNEEPEALASADLKDAVVKLPPGLTVNPSSANGLIGCTPAQFGLTTPVGTSPIQTTPGPAECPDASKIGTVEVDTPLLDHPLPGAVYVAQPFQNPFGTLLAIYIGVADPISGVVVKLAGRVDIGAEGQLTTTFSDNPQLPFDDFKLDFFGGPNAALKTPAVCGHYATSSSLTPWSTPASGPSPTPGDAYDVSRPPSGAGSCPTSPGAEPNTPDFEAGSESPLAGAFSPFVLHLTRPDGSQQFASLTVTPPPGLLGSLVGIPYCPEAALAAAAAKSGTEELSAPSCPPGSRVGSVTVGAGAGPRPVFVTGTAYLAGPYKGAPLSLAIVTPAVAGPYDLGDVVVRAALEVNQETSQITVKSDPIPTQLQGIPLDVRSIAVRMDRPNFTLNPTSCETMAVGGSLGTVQGGTVPLSNRFQVSGCTQLPFKPRLALRVFGKTGRNAKPRFRAVLTAKRGEANIARAQVNLPHSEFLEQAHIKTVCTRVQFAAGDGNGSACPKDSIYGHARAITPLLDKPLEGPVFLRSSSHELPDLVAALNGQIAITLDGTVDTGPNEGIRNTFELVPDAPVSKFILELRGGKKGLLVNSENLCSKRAKRRAIVRFIGHNGKVRSFKPMVANSCGKASKKRGPHRRRGSASHRPASR